MTDAAEQLLAATIAHAISNVPFYRKFSGSNGVCPDLNGLPIVSRQDFASSRGEFLASDSTADILTMSSGTTGLDTKNRSPLLCPRSSVEAAALARLQQSCSDIMGSRGRGLRIITSLNGQVIPIGNSVCCPLERPGHFEAAMHILAEDKGGRHTPKIRNLQGNTDPVKTFCLMYMRNKDHSITFERVWIGGEHLTLRWRNLICSAFSAEVVELYGLTEAPGLTGWFCPHCHGFHFSPTAHREWLALDSDKPLTSGICRLVVTCYYPLVQCRPVIRYDTGDLFDLKAEPCLATGLPSAQLLGRRSQCSIDLSAQELLLAPRFINEVLDSYPAIQRKKVVSPMPIDDYEIGLPDYSFEEWQDQGCSRLRVTIKTITDPLLYPELQSLTLILKKLILKEHTHLSKRVKAGSLDLEVSLSKA